MFRSADPSRKTPAWLQPHTKENILWQFATTVLMVVTMEVWERHNEKKALKARNST